MCITHYNHARAERMPTCPCGERPIKQRGLCHPCYMRALTAGQIATNDGSDRMRYVDRYIGGAPLDPAYRQAQHAAALEASRALAPAERPEFDTDGGVQIPLANDRGVAIVDPGDYDRLAGYAWYLHETPTVSYARATIYTPTKRNVYMHHMILTPPDGMTVDHVNGNGLDNRSANLRIATRAQQQHNTRRRRTNQSGFKGVRYVGGRWRAELRVGGAQRRLGVYDDPITAARAYDDAARHHFGEYALVNFPAVDA